MAAFGNQIDILNYSCKLNDLDDDHLFLIASSYEAEAFDKKIYTINSIINKIKLLSKEEFMKFDEKINELLKKKKEGNKLTENPKILISDKIFFVFAPKVDASSTKILCCLPLNSVITFIYFLNAFLQYDYLSTENIDPRTIWTVVLFYFNGLFLYISMTDENSSFAKIALYNYELLLIRFLFHFNLFASIILFIYCCIEIYIFLLLIYISYIQMVIAKNKENQKI